MRRFIALSCLSLFLGFPAAQAAAAPKNITVLELFTSQLCVETPTANNALAPIALDAPENLITIGCHVTFFDNEQTRDPYSHDFCDDRVSGYDRNNTFSLTNVPLLIVNGIYDNRAQSPKIIQSSIRMGQATSTISPIQLEKTDLSLNITMPKLRLDKPADIWIFAYKDMDHVSFTEGPNIGKDVTYSNIALFSAKLANWNGDYMNMSFALADMPEAATGYAVIAQYSDFTGIVAAAKMDKK
jgi:hypothetical protein